MNKLMIHDIYRDYLAVKYRAETEVAVDSVVGNRADLIAVAGNKRLLFEVKVLTGSGSSELQQAVGQLQSYSAMYKDLEDDGKETEIILYCILSSSYSQRSSQLAQLTRFKLYHSNVRVMTEVLRDNFPDVYDIGGYTIDRAYPAKKLAHERVDRIKSLFKMTGNVAQPDREFLIAICDRWFRLSGWGTCIGVTMGEWEGGTVIYAHSNHDVRSVTLVEAIDCWFRLEHHRWLAVAPRLGGG